VARDPATRAAPEHPSGFPWKRALRVGAITGVVLYAVTLVVGGFLFGGFDQPGNLVPNLALMAVAEVAASIVVVSVIVWLRPDMPDKNVGKNAGVIALFLVPLLAFLWSQTVR